MKTSDKLTKEQVLAIPKLLRSKSMAEVGREYGVSFQAIWYWVKKLRQKGVGVRTRRKGQKGLLEKHD